MNKRQRKKQAKKQLQKRNALFEQNNLKVSSSKNSAKFQEKLSNYISPILNRLSKLEEVFTKIVDDYVLQKAKEKAMNGLSITKDDFPAIEFVDYYNEMLDNHFILSRNELKVVPDLYIVRNYYRLWKKAYADRLEEGNKGFKKIQDYYEAEEHLKERMSEYFVDHQFDESALMNFILNVKSFTLENIERYLDEREEELDRD